MMGSTVRERAASFCKRYNLQLPILEAPMAGACPPERAAAVSQAGGMGALGALLSTPAAIADWVSAFRTGGGTRLQINLWVPDPAPVREVAHEAAVARFLSRWGPTVAEGAGDARPPDFVAQCDASVAAQPDFVSSIMGLFPAPFVARLKAAGIAWLATATTLAEALAAEAAGADAIVAQGIEAGGHRGSFDAAASGAEGVGLMALVPILTDRLSVPVIATGGIADGRGVAAALTLGASAVSIGTGLLRCPESAIAPAWADGLATTPPEGPTITRAFSGRRGRALPNGYIHAAASPDAPLPAPYPIQRGLTAAMREAAVRHGDFHSMQAWSGQACMLSTAEPAADLIRRMWHDATEILV